MRFRPCIDLHHGQVKQIVGSTLKTEQGEDVLETNFTSDLPPAYYANLYRKDGLTGGHIIMLGPGNEEAAHEALATWPGGMQVGGGISVENASYWLEAGASHVIVTSHVFHDGAIDMQRLERLCKETGKEHLVLDLSCRKKGQEYFVVTDRWQKFTSMTIKPSTLQELSAYCAEFLVHAVDVEGKNMGIDKELLTLLAASAHIPMTYAGGVSSLADMETIKKTGQGKIDATVGSALDIFGGTGVQYHDVVQRYS